MAAVFCYYQLQSDFFMPHQSNPCWLKIKKPTGCSTKANLTLLLCHWSSGLLWSWSRQMSRYIIQSVETSIKPVTQQQISGLQSLLAKHIFIITPWDWHLSCPLISGDFVCFGLIFNLQICQSCGTACVSVCQYHSSSWITCSVTIYLYTRFVQQTSDSHNRNYNSIKMIINVLHICSS